MNTPQSTVGRARRTAVSAHTSYLEQVTAADEYRRAALTAQQKMDKARKMFKDAQAEFAAAIYGMSENGLTGGQIAREVGISPTHARNIVHLEKLRRSPGTSTD